jgi:hypothetical protein
MTGKRINRLVETFGRGANEGQRSGYPGFRLAFSAGTRANLAVPLCHSSLPTSADAGVHG